MKLYIKFRKIHKIVAFAYKNTHIKNMKFMRNFKLEQKIEYPF